MKKNLSSYQMIKSVLVILCLSVSYAQASQAKDEKDSMVNYKCTVSRTSAASPVEALKGKEINLSINKKVYKDSLELSYNSWILKATYKLAHSYSSKYQNFYPATKYIAAPDVVQVSLDADLGSFGDSGMLHLNPVWLKGSGFQSDDYLDCTKAE